MPFDVVGKEPPFSFFVTVDGGSSSGDAGAVVECRERNNDSAASGVRCWGID
jgi:hypothetical protein